MTVCLSSYCDRNIIINAMNEKTKILEKESEEDKSVSAGVKTLSQFCPSGLASEVKCIHVLLAI